MVLTVSTSQRVHFRGAPASKVQGILLGKQCSTEKATEGEWLTFYSEILCIKVDQISYIKSYSKLSIQCPEMTEEHIVALAKLCRVCGRPLAEYGKAVRKYQCSNHQPDLKTTFGIDISSDDQCLHPSSFCHPCKNIIYSTKKAIKDKKEFIPTKIIHQWEEHKEMGCTICSHAPKVGRPKKMLAGHKKSQSSLPFSI